MSMFDNYQNLNPNYAPDNRRKTVRKTECFNANIPQKQTNAMGEFIGYKWNEGDIFAFSVNMNDSICVESDAIIYDTPQESPNSQTVGDFGQKAYNTSDMKSWICLSCGQLDYEWELQKCFIHPRKTKRMITLKNNIRLANQTVDMSIKNFRDEVIYSSSVVCDENCEVVIDITKEISDILLSDDYTIEFREQNGVFIKSISIFVE